MQAITKFLNYCATHPDAVVGYYSSDMILWIQSDASYLSETKARSCTAGHHYLSNKPPNPDQPPAPNDPSPPMNGAIVVPCKVMREVRNVHVDTHNELTDPLAEQNNRSQRQIQATQITPIIYLAHLYQRQGIFSIVFGSRICQSTWCAICYRTPLGVDFLVYRPRDKVTGEPLIEEGTERQYLEARPGDHLLCSSECEACGFRRLSGAWARVEDHTDEMTMNFTRPANLNAFWSRETGTVRANLRSFLEQVKLGESCSFQMFNPPGPFGSYYDPGMRAAMGVLHKLQQPGRHEDKIKFSTAWKTRSVHSNLYKASPHGGGSRLVMRSDKRRSFLSRNPTDSEWFSCFMTGFEARVGQRTKQDMAINIEVMMEMERLNQEQWAEAVAMDDLPRM
jgi:hypothetical protein